MQKWDYTFRYVWIHEGNRALSGINPSMIWTKRKKDGMTQLEEIQKMGDKGWELINTTPISIGASGSPTSYLLFTFKRPIEE